MLGEDRGILWAGEDQERDLRARGRLEAIETGRIETNTWFMRKDGSRFFGNEVLTTIRNEQGQVDGFSKIIRDITERNALEEALFAEKERAEVTLNSIADAVLSTDLSGNLTYLNRVAERMTGWSCAEAVGKPVAEVFRVIDDLTSESAQNPIELAVDQRKLARSANCILVRRD